jgi:hypothetical protein
MVNVIKLSGIMLCHYVECYYAECHYTECHYDECHYAKCHYAECHYSKCHNAAWHYDKCHGAYTFRARKELKDNKNGTFSRLHSIILIIILK